ncbi:MAG: peptide-methionine (S)-S-oxide reductase MsrA [Nitrososphaerota archaeon]|nr:peptide-methionine (S)-S-oxide reductase MsrA [Nitrososphaerota archaeon]
MSHNAELATLGGGCFWCVEAVFSELRGIEKVESGYSGGTVLYPSYEEVCTGDTSHAEVVQLSFDPTVISYREILDVFFSVHDPTTLNRQGPDVGTQYRSVIFFHNPEQKLAAEDVIKHIQQSGIWDDQIVTRVEPYKAFYKAEDYHQQYFKSNPNQPYCRAVIAPKVAKFRKHYLEKLRK